MPPRPPLKPPLLDLIICNYHTATNNMDVWEDVPIASALGLVVYLA